MTPQKEARHKRDLYANIHSMMNTELTAKIKTFMENEARSCSMDFGCITPQYVYRMWGGEVPLAEIETALSNIKVHGH